MNGESVNVLDGNEHEWDLIISREIFCELVYVRLLVIGICANCVQNNVA